MSWASRMTGTTNRTKDREWKGGRKRVCLRQSKHGQPLSWRPESSSVAGGGGPATPHPKCWSSWGGSSSDAGRSVTPGPTPDAKVPASSFCPNAMVHHVWTGRGLGTHQNGGWWQQWPKTVPPGVNMCSLSPPVTLHITLPGGQLAGQNSSIQNTGQAPFQAPGY